MAFPLASPTDRTAILLTTQTFLSGIRLKDPSLMRACILPTGHGVLLRRTAASKMASAAPEGTQRAIDAFRQAVPASTTDLVPLTLSLGELVDRLPLSQAGYDGDEVIDEEQCVVCVDSEFGVAFTPYQFFESGRLHHTGSNSLSFVKVPGFEVGGVRLEWLITGVADIAKNV